MHNARVFGLSYTSDSDLVKNHKSKTRPWRFFWRFFILKLDLVVRSI